MAPIWRLPGEFCAIKLFNYQPGIDVMIFFNMFAEKFGENIGVFLLKTKPNFEKISHNSNF
jgi:hypothetical protein